MKPTTYSERGLELTRTFEGCRFRAYRDGGGVWTIGYGHTRGVREGQECDMPQAVAWLRQDVLEAIGIVQRLVKVELNQNQFDALVDFAFNVGEGRPATPTSKKIDGLSTSTLLRLLNVGDYAGAAAQFERWNKDNGVVVPGLTRRRLAEKKLFLEGMQ